MMGHSEVGLEQTGWGSCSGTLPAGRPTEQLPITPVIRLPGLLAQGAPEPESTLFKKPCNRSLNPT